MTNRFKDRVLENDLWEVKICVLGYLDGWIKDYFGELDINYSSDGISTLTGELIDLSAVFGLILQIRDSGISPISLEAHKKIEGRVIYG